MGGGGGGIRQDFESSWKFANIAREQYDDYKRRFRPVERQLQAIAGDSGTEVKNALGFARSAADQQFDAAPGESARDLARMGVTMRPEEQAAMLKGNEMAKAGFLAGAENQARLAVRDRRDQIMSGGMAQTGVRNLFTGAK